MKSNPPIKGHALCWGAYDERGRFHSVLRCECGAHPDDPNWFFLSDNAIRRWHRQHKDEIRAKQADQ